jgi:hypothetical protein
MFKGAWGKWISWRGSKHFILLAWLGQLSYHKKLGIIKFMFSLSDKFFIVHVLDSNFLLYTINDMKIAFF